MAVIATELESKVKLTFNAGNDEDGNAIIKSKTFSRVKSDATDDNIYAVANGIAGLQEYPVNTIRKFEEYDLIEQ